MTTDRGSYRAGDAARFTVHNGSPDTLYASLCGSRIEQATGATWAYRDSFACGLSLPGADVPTAVPGGTTEVELDGHFVRDLAPGTFRLRLWLTDSGGTPLPDSVRTSTPFDVVLTGGE